MPDPALPQLTVWPATDDPPVTVAVHVTVPPTSMEPALQETSVCVSATLTVVGLKFAVIVPTPLMVTVVEADDESATTRAEASLTLQPENA